MGMTDIQFKAFVRLLLAMLKNIMQEQDAEKREQSLRQLIQLLQNTLED